MIKNTLLALVAVASLGAVAPAFANDSASGDSYDALDDNGPAIVNRLQAQGIDATAVEDWGNQVRAYVTLEDGTQVMQYFDLNTLQPVNI
tara:strand:+ start:600 stop:869 length:270 start_codon:yes stop_codon:yes gene_type:complete